MSSNFKRVFILGMLSLAGAAAASAGTITLYFSGQDRIAITLTESGNDSLITAISGTYDGATIGTLIAPGELSGNDNMFFTPAPYLDASGVAFTLTSEVFGESYIDLFYVPGFPPYYDSVLADGPSTVDEGRTDQFDLVVPEPGAAGITLLGLVCVFARRRGIS